MSPKILIVEDDLNEAELVRFQLERAGYTVRLAVDGTEGLRLACAWQPDLILLDVMMPHMSGWTVCEHLRRITNVPIIFLTVMDQEKHVIRGLELGADDYIAKPYNHRELLARIAAVLRRQAMQTVPLSGAYVYGDLEIDFDRRRVSRGDETIYLTPLEYKLLCCLAQRPGKCFPHEYLLRRVWGGDHQSHNCLKLYVCYLRRKLEHDPANPEIILTDHGTGYRLNLPQRVKRIGSVA